MNIKVEREKDLLFVEVEVKHIQGTRSGKKEYKTSDVLQRLSNLGYNVDYLQIVTECRVFNYQTLKRCKGLWVFKDKIQIFDLPEVIDVEPPRNVEPVKKKRTIIRKKKDE